MPVPRGEPQIGFVSHNCPVSPRPCGLVPPVSGGDWVRFASFAFPGLDLPKPSRIGFVSHSRHRAGTLEKWNIGMEGHVGPLGIGFVLHDLPSRERRSPDRHRGGNWVCLYNTPRPEPRSSEGAGFVFHFTLQTSHLELPQIGFVCTTAPRAAHVAGNWLCLTR